MMNNQKQQKNIARSLPKADINRILALLIFTVTALFSLSVSAISEAELEAELNSGSSFERVSSSEIQFRKNPYIEQGSKASQNINRFHARLLQNRPAAVPSEEVTKWIPIAGDITIFVPKKETAYPLAKRVGDQFVQERLVRLQMYNTLGRHLLSVSYSSEAAQIDALYNNAYDLANRAGFNKKFGDQLVQADINPYGLDVIWPEIRRINGEDVLVPVLHLSAQTLENQLVDGHTVEFIGPGAQFNNITIESGSITTRKNALLQAAQNFIVGEGASFTSEGDMNLAVGGTLLNHGHLTAEQNINILAGNYVQKTAVHRFHSSHGLGERLGLISTVNAGQSLTIESLSDIAIFGAGIQAGNDIVLDAQGNITVGTVALTWQESYGLRNSSYQRSSVEHIQSSLTAGDNIKMMAGGLIEINAATLHADQGHIELLAELGVTIIDELNQDQYVSHRKFGNFTADESSYVTIAMRSILDAGKGIRIHTAAGDITLRAADITSSDGTSVYAESGAINMLMTVENDHYSYNSVREKFWTVKTVSRGHNFETAVPNTIIGGFQAEALYGVKVEYEGDPNLSHAEQIAALSQMPGMEWMEDIRQQHPDIDWQAVETVYEEWNKKKTSLSPAALAVIAIVVTVCTAGAGAGIVNATAGSWQAAVANAAFSSMVSTASIATSNAIVNGESFDDVLTAGIEAVHSDEGMKSVATAVVTAGAIWYVDTQFFIPSDADVQALADAEGLGTVVKGTTEYNQLFEELSRFSFGEQALQALTHSTVDSGIRTFIAGGGIDEFGQNFRMSLAQNSINLIGKNVSETIGNAAKADPPQISVAAQYIAHAALGCATGLLTAETNDSDIRDGCLSGAGGAVIGEFIAAEHARQLEEDLETWVVKHLDPDKHYSLQEFDAEVKSFLQRGIDLGRLGAAFSAFALGVDPNIAGTAADNAATYNATNDVDVSSIYQKWGRIQWRNANPTHALYLDAMYSSSDRLARIYSGEGLDIYSDDFWLQEVENNPTLSNIISAAASQGLKNLDANMALLVEVIKSSVAKYALAETDANAELIIDQTSTGFREFQEAMVEAKYGVEYHLNYIKRLEQERLDAVSNGDSYAAEWKTGQIQDHIKYIGDILAEATIAVDNAGKRGTIYPGKDLDDTSLPNNTEYPVTEEELITYIFPEVEDLGELPGYYEGTDIEQGATYVNPAPDQPGIHDYIYYRKIEVGEKHPQTGHDIEASIDVTTQSEHLVEMTVPSAKGKFERYHYLENPGHHDPNGGNVPYNSSKSVLPSDSVELFLSSKEYMRPDGGISRYAMDSQGHIHQFQDTLGNGVFHWAGSENGVRLDGSPNGLTVGKEIRDLFK